MPLAEPELTLKEALGCATLQGVVLIGAFFLLMSQCTACLDEMAKPDTAVECSPR